MTNIAGLTGQDFNGMIATGVTVVEFWATWCGPCKMQLPILEEVSTTAPAGVKFAKVNVEEEPELTSSFSIQSIPTMVIFKDGVKVNTLLGLTSKATLTEAISKALRV